MKLDRYKIHDVDIVVYRLKVGVKDRQRIYDDVVTSMKHGNKSLIIMDYETNEVRHFSRSLICTSSGISYPEPEQNLFSFNSPYGACKSCSGLGEVAEVDIEKIIPDTSKTIKKGGIVPLC